MIRQKEKICIKIKKVVDIYAKSGMITKDTVFILRRDYHD